MARGGALDALATAIHLYTDPFLDGFTLPASAEFDVWVTGERQSWERRYLDAMALLVDAYAASGAYAEAIATAQRALRTDPLAEEMHRQLITLYAAAGDRTAALRQFEPCVIILERELGVTGGSQRHHNLPMSLFTPGFQGELTARIVGRRLVITGGDRMFRQLRQQEQHLCMIFLLFLSPPLPKITIVIFLPKETGQKLSLVEFHRLFHPDNAVVRLLTVGEGDKGFL